MATTSKPLSQAQVALNRYAMNNNAAYKNEALDNIDKIRNVQISTDSVGIFFQDGSWIRCAREYDGSMMVYSASEA